MNKTKFAIAIILIAAVISCNQPASKKAATEKNIDTAAAKGTYGFDAAFLKQHTKNVLELQSDDANSKVLLSADYQGRVMTSTAAGNSGSSFGWMNYELIAAAEKKKQFNPVGGEERFWLGPEGGKYSIYFKGGDSFNIANWQVPAIIDTIGFELVSADKSQAVFSKNAVITNYSGTVFSIAITRKIILLDKINIEQKLKAVVPAGIEYVAFETDNTITNTGTNEWKKQRGLLSIWLLGMMTPSDETKVIIPFSPQANARAFIADNYFGKISPERLQVKDSVLYFRCDGKERSKIGISPFIAKAIAGSFDFKKNVLTIVIPQIDKSGAYVNSKWELQNEPYKGDVINAYNDGPLQDGSQLGPFYEIESSSAAKELKPGETQGYRQTTCHFQGDYEGLALLAKQLLGVDLDEVKNW